MAKPKTPTAAARLPVLLLHLNALRHALYYLGEHQDFAPGGKHRAAWDKVRPLLVKLPEETA